MDFWDNRMGEDLMSKLNIDQQTIFQLFSDKKSDFLIPDYQRPYAWEKTNAKLFGMIFLHLPFPIMTIPNLTATMSIFWGQLLLFAIKIKNLK